MQLLVQQVKTLRLFCYILFAFDVKYIVVYPTKLLLEDLVVTMEDYNCPHRKSIHHSCLFSL